MTWPGQRWTPGDLGVGGTLFSRSAGSGGAETLERILESQRNRRTSTSSDSSGGGGAGLMAEPPPPVVFSRTAPPVTATATVDGPVYATITADTTGSPVYIPVTINGGPTMWVPVIDGTGAIQLVVATGDVIAATGATAIDITGGT